MSAREAAATPGQAAYAALRMSWLANRIGSPSLEWDKLSDEERAEWDEILATARERPAPDSVPDLLLDKMDQLDRIGDMCRRPADVAGRSSGSGVVNGTNLAAAILRVVEEAPRIPQAAVTAAAAAQPAPGDVLAGLVTYWRGVLNDLEASPFESSRIEAETLREVIRQVEQAAPIGTAWRLLEELRANVNNLASQVQASADATRPSKKTSIEDEIAIALRKLTEGK